MADHTPLVDFGACPKCGLSIPSVVYISADGDGSSGGWPRHCGSPEWKGREHFHVKCSRCGFSWHADMVGVQHA